MPNTRVAIQELDNCDPSYLGLMNSMKKRLTENSNQPSSVCSIYRVPILVRQLKEDAYTPRLVSIGPFHYGHENLKAMEVHKNRYTQSLFQRIQGTGDIRDLTYSKCARSVLSTEVIARQLYSGHDHDPTIFGLNQEKLAEILLVDGCFILEVLLRWENYSHNYSNDPIFGNVWMINCIQRDLLLLENQIPFFVLVSLFNIIQESIPNGENLSLQQLCVSFHLKLNLNAQATNNNIGVRHLLDFVRSCHLPSDPNTYPKSNQTLESKSIHCATKLEECGIKFVKGSTEQLFNFKFNSSDGVLEIPFLSIQGATESLLRNMVSFEQCCSGTRQHITSYVMLMDRLIDTSQDAELLEQKRIIANHLGSGEDVSKLFNNMFKEVVMENFFFDTLCGEINRYYNLRWPRYKAFFARNHCSNPWRIMSLIAAFVLLGLAAVQTGYSVASYYPH